MNFRPATVRDRSSATTSAQQLCVPAQVIVVRSQKPALSDRGHGRHRSDGGGRKPRLVDVLATRSGYFRLPGAQVRWCDRAQPMHVPHTDASAWLPLVLAACPLSPAASLPALPGTGCSGHGGNAMSAGMDGTGRIADDLYLLAHDDRSGICCCNRGRWAPGWPGRCWPS